MVIFIYLIVGLIFNLMTSNPISKKNFWWYFALVIDIIGWPIVILIFEIKKWKSK
jgi:hypothetical protein